MGKLRCNFTSKLDFNNLLRLLLPTGRGVGPPSRAHEQSGQDFFFIVLNVNPTFESGDSSSVPVEDEDDGQVLLLPKA